MKTGTVIGLLLFLTNVNAFAADSHRPVKVNFDQLIEENTQANQGLTKEISQNYKETPVLTARKHVSTVAEKEKVADFVDFEIRSVDRDNVAGQKPTADHRYN